MPLDAASSVKLSKLKSPSFWQDVVTYASRVNQFSLQDWIVYIVWVGMMYGLGVAVLIFTLSGVHGGVSYPTYVWNIPLGVFIFSTAIAFDTIGHRTVYKEYLQEKGEALVHHITIFAGIGSVVLMCLGYTYPQFLRIPSLVFIAFSIVYSLIDEALHWHRYMNKKSDRVEMWSHYFIFIGHTIMILSWWQWFAEGYPGVKETLPFLPL
jgi:hypothetical protein